MSNWLGERKQIVREYQLRTERSYETTLFMPGWDLEHDVGCLCIERALEMGTITLDTRIVAVERDRRLVDQIDKRLNQFGFTTPPILFPIDLKRITAFPEPLDFAYLDLVGNLDTDLAIWIADVLVPSLQPGATLAFTFTHNHRTNHFVAETARRWRLEDKLREIILRFSHAIHVNDDRVLVHLATLKSCLHMCRADYRKAVIYRDRVRNMVAGRLDNIEQLAASDWPSIHYILGGEEGFVVPSTLQPWEIIMETLSQSNMPRRSRRKSKAQELFDKRSDAAHRAWDTRRKNAVVTNGQVLPPERSASATPTIHIHGPVVMIGFGGCDDVTVVSDTAARLIEQQNGAVAHSDGFPKRKDMHQTILDMLKRGPRSSREIEALLAERFNITQHAIQQQGCPPWRNHVSWALVDLGVNKRGTGQIELIERKPAPDGGVMGVYRLA